jgi:hypothetical protein
MESPHKYQPSTIEQDAGREIDASPRSVRSPSQLCSDCEMVLCQSKILESLCVQKLQSLRVDRECVKNLIEKLVELVPKVSVEERIFGKHN